MRIKVHPDKLIKPDTSKEEIAKINDVAARVGQAAEILLDPRKVSYGARSWAQLLTRWTESRT